MGYKRFVRIVVIFIVGFVLYNFFVWNLSTRQFFGGTGFDGMGDLARLGYMPEYGVRKQVLSTHLPGMIYYDQYKGQPVDMVVVGDSFSMGVGGGQYNYFHEYIILNSGKEDFTVLSLVNPKGPKPDVIWRMINSGFLDSIRPKYLLIENVERSCIENYGVPVDTSVTDTIDNLHSYFMEGSHLARQEVLGVSVAGGGEDEFFSFINLSNLKHPFYRLLYGITDKPPGAKVYKTRLDREMFGTSHPDTLLFLHTDILQLNDATPATVAMFNSNLNTLAGALAPKGIKLIFMPPPDKYTIYRPYILDDSYPRGRFFDLMRGQRNREYEFIDTEAILSKVAGEGVLDLYHQDDTHWSWKATDRIFREFRIEED